MKVGSGFRPTGIRDGARRSRDDATTVPGTFVVAARWSAVVPDITVLGPYTYLATELFWGAVAVGLLRYADAFREAARTIAVLYPVGYVWDWYTLQAGVFEIPLRTGVEVLGIPLEEHLFVLVVVAMVVGTHEALAEYSDGRTDAPA